MGKKHFVLINLFFLSPLIGLISLLVAPNFNFTYASTSSYFNMKSFIQSTNMSNPLDILNTSGTGASTNCFSYSCWSIRVSNPNFAEIPANATITGARFRLYGTGSGGYLQVLIGKNSTYCLKSSFVGDLSTAPQSANGFLVSSNYQFANCNVNGSPSSIYDLSSFFLEIIAPKSNPVTLFNFINPQVAFDYTIVPTATPSITPFPTPTSIPTPTSPPPPRPGPEPFLELPWDYEAVGETFETAAFDPESWFDHKYPLQNILCCTMQVLKYTGIEQNDAYRSHSGYDYALRNGVKLDTPVLAAAGGNAIFVPENKSGGAGNMIKIDHGNGYQTWYEHLGNQDLIVSSEGNTKLAQKGQMIGRVGMTGNTGGPHIHFSVFKDSNGNDSFADDYPLGLVDPLGWEGKDKDPWTEYGGNDKFGSESFNLFIKRKQAQSKNIPTSGDSVVFNNLSISIPDNAYNTLFTINYNDSSFDAPSARLKSVAPSFILNALNAVGQKFTQFLKPIQFIYDYSASDLININEDSLKIYYFNEASEAWEALPSVLDKQEKTVKAETSHFSRFTLAGEVLDTAAPISEAEIIGDKGQHNWYRSDVKVQLTGIDNDGGVGIEDTLYSLNNSDWFAYESPIEFTTEGRHEIWYVSFDKANNKEVKKFLEINIDKTPPGVWIDATPSSIWPPNGKYVDVRITGNIEEENQFINTFKVFDEYGKPQPFFTNFNQLVKLEAKRNGNDLDGRIYTISAQSEDLAGNKIKSAAEVVVLHDQR